MNISIDVIVPIYRGTKYIDKQIEQIDIAAGLVEANITLWFSNDDPRESVIINRDTRNIRIRCINSEHNEGIQAARIKAFLCGSGDYVHFLDQDDLIEPLFYCSQLKRIGDNDAVYCRCYNGTRQTYNYERVFETAFERNNILRLCPVISPGQVVIKRAAIPDFWIKNKLKSIGADDYLLWLSMYSEGCSFICNQDLLFTHVRNGDNYSSDILRTLDSDREMVKLLIDSDLFDSSDCELLEELPDRQLRRRYNPQMKDQIVLYFLSNLLELEEKGITLELYLLKKKIYKVAIYGAAIMGERIKGFLYNSNIEVVCFIDKNAPFIKTDIPVVKLEDVTYDFDAIIVSLISRENEVIGELCKFGKAVLVIKQVINEMNDIARNGFTK